MSKPRPPEVLIHVLGGTGSGRTTFVRRFLHDIFNSSYDPTCPVGPERKLVDDVTGAKVVIGLETSPVNLYRHDSEIDRMIGPADAMISIMAPGRATAMDETARLRLEVLDKAIESRGRLIERVVIMKDIDVAWNVNVPEYGCADLKPDDIDDEERSRREQEWGKGAERGYKLAKKLGAEVTIACPRTDQGVKEVVHELTLQILEERKAAAEKARRLEEETRRREEGELGDKEGRVRPLASRLKRIFGAAKNRGPAAG